LDDAKFQPFSHVLFYFLSVGIWDFKLFDIDWLLSFEHDLMEKHVSLSEVQLVEADHVLVYQNELHPLFPELIWDCLADGVFNVFLFLGRDFGGWDSLMG